MDGQSLASAVFSSSSQLIPFVRPTVLEAQRGVV